MMQSITPLIKRSLLLLIVVQALYCAAQDPCYIPYQKPECLLSSADNFAEAIEKQVLHNRQGASIRRHPEGTPRRHQPGIDDLLASSKYGNTFDSLYHLSVQQLVDTFGAELLCEQVELDIQNNYISHGWRDETYTGSFKFKWYTEPKECYNDPYNTILFDFSIPRRGIPSLGKLTINRRNNRRTNGGRTKFLPALDSSKREAIRRLEKEPAGKYYLQSSREELNKGARSRTLPFERHLLAFGTGATTRGPNLSYLKLFETPKKSRYHYWDPALVAGTLIGKHTFVDSIGALRHLLTYKVHHGYAVHDLDELLFLSLSAEGFQGSHSAQMPSLGQFQLLYVQKMSGTEDVRRDVPANFVGDTLQVYNRCSFESQIVDEIDFLGKIKTSYKERFPNVRYQKHAPYLNTSLQNRFVSSLGKDLPKKPVLNLSNMQILVANEHESELQVCQWFDASDPFLHLENLTIPYLYDTVVFGDRVVEKGNIEVLIDNYATEDGSVLITHLADNYDVKLSDIKPGEFTLTLQRKNASASSLLPLIPNARRYDLTKPKVVFLISADPRVNLSDTLLVVDYNNPLLSAAYSTPGLEVEPFGGFVDNRQLLHPDYKGKNYSIDIDDSPIIEKVTPPSISPGDTLTIIGQHLDKGKDVSFTGTITLDGFTYYRYFKASPKSIIESSATQWKVIVPEQGPALHSKDFTVKLTDGLMKVGYSSYSPVALEVESKQ